MPQTDRGTRWQGAALGAVLAVCACSRDPSRGEASRSVRRVEIAVTERGFEPSPVTVVRGQPLELVVTRRTDATCATEIVVDSPPLRKALPLNRSVSLVFTPEKSGEIVYGCAMDKMLGGVLRVE